LGWTTLGELPSGQALGAPHRRLPRHPRALPVHRHPRLVELRASVEDVVERRRLPGGQVIGEPALADDLLALGAELEATGETSQAYLALVWSAAADRRRWRDVADAVHRLRQPPTDESHSLELTLLRHYYASRDAAALARLVGFYVASEKLEEARYFLARAPAPDAAEELWQRLHAAVGSLARGTPVDPGVAHDPLEGGFEFEGESLAGWKGDRKSFRSGAWSARDRYQVGLRGYQGDGVLSSRKPRRGRLTSPEFTIDGDLMSLLVGGGGGKARVGVRLLVDGQPVRSIQAIGTGSLVPRLWDVAELRGQKARLEVFDQSTRARVLLDRVLVWR
jgi:plasmid stabilization system protein ParE